MISIIIHLHSGSAIISASLSPRYLIDTCGYKKTPYHPDNDVAQPETMIYKSMYLPEYVGLLQTLDKTSGFVGAQEPHCMFRYPASVHSSSWICSGLPGCSPSHILGLPEKLISTEDIQELIDSRLSPGFRATSGRVRVGSRKDSMRGD